MSTLASDDRGLILGCPQCGQNNRLPYSRIGQQPRCAKCGHELPHPAAPVEVETDAGFAALTTQSPLPVLVDFWAAWCGPCKMIAPELEKVAAGGSGQWVVAKVNTEAVPNAPRRLGVSSIPLLVLFHGGREVARQAGAMPAPAIQQFIQRQV